MIRQAIGFVLAPLLAAFLAAGCSSISKMPGMSAVGALSSEAKAAQGQESSLAAASHEIAQEGEAAPAATGSIVPAKEESEAVNWARGTQGNMDGAEAKSAAAGAISNNEQAAASADDEEEELTPEELDRQELINRGAIEEGQPIPSGNADQ